MTNKEQAVMRFLRRKTFATAADVAERFAFSRSMANEYLRRLNRMDLLEVRELGRLTGYRAK